MSAFKNEARVQSLYMVLIPFWFACSDGRAEERGIAASEDPRLALSGKVDLPSTKDGVTEPSGRKVSAAIVSGPVFVTDLILNGWDGTLFMARDNDCQEWMFDFFTWDSWPPEANTHTSRAVAGLRYFVPAGHTLCGRSYGPAWLVWSAFRPRIATPPVTSQGSGAR